MATKRQIECQINKLRKELAKIEDREVVSASQKLVGRCFKYHNSYSDPKDDSERWWTYCYVVGLSGNGTRIIVWFFEKDIYGKIEIEPRDDRHYSAFDNPKYIRIPYEEFILAWEELMMELKALSGEE